MNARDLLLEKLARLAERLEGIDLERQDRHELSGDLDELMRIASAA